MYRNQAPQMDRLTSRRAKATLHHNPAVLSEPPYAFPQPVLRCKDGRPPEEPD